MIQLASDLHLECGGIYELCATWNVASDTLLLAGDIVEVVLLKKKNHLAWAFLEMVNREYKHVFWVMGNHEFYNNHISYVVRNARDRLKEHDLNNIIVLDNDTVETDKFVIFGSTFWTDMNKGSPVVMWHNSRRMNDYARIKYDDAYLERRNLDVEATVGLHAIARKKLEVFMKLETSKKKIVMTHHAPSFLSIPRHQWADTMSYAYATELQSEIYGSDIDLWVHGHTHHKIVYVIGETVVASHARGYFGYDRSAELFKPLTIELGEMKWTK